MFQTAIKEDISNLRIPKNISPDIRQIVCNQLIAAVTLSEPYRAFVQFAGILDQISVEGFLKAIDGALRVQVEPIPHSDTGRLHLTIYRRKLRNLLNNTLSERILSQTRTRNSLKLPTLEFLSVILDGNDDIVGILDLNWKTGNLLKLTLNPNSSQRNQTDYITDIIKSSAETICRELTRELKGGTFDT
jgi:hypothetical protein